MDLESLLNEGTDFLNKQKDVTKMRAALVMLMVESLKKNGFNKDEIIADFNATINKVYDALDKE